MLGSSDKITNFIEGFSDFSDVQIVKISLLIGVVCGITASGIFFFRIGHYVKHTISYTLYGIGYIILIFMFGFLPSWESNSHLIWEFRDVHFYVG